MRPGIRPSERSPSAQNNMTGSRKYIKSTGKRDKQKRREQQVAKNCKKAATATQNTIWEEHLAALKNFKKRNGHCNVPTRYGEDTALGRWVEKTRAGRCSGQPLSQAQRDELTNLGFHWETLTQKNEREWNEKYDRLKSYRNLFGDCNVPTSCKKDPEKTPWVEELGVWVSRQKSQYRKGRLQDWQKRKLDAIAFDPSYLNAPPNKDPDTTLRDRQWMRQYQRLVAFQEEHGHCLVTRSSVAADKDSHPLFFWVKGQRDNAHRNEIRQDRKELLDEIGFVWSFDDGINRRTNRRANNPDTERSYTHHQKQWEKMFGLLEDYKKQHGLVSVTKTSCANATLGNWLDHQRVQMRKGTLDVVRFTRLLAIGVSVHDNRKRKRSA